MQCVTADIELKQVKPSISSPGWPGKSTAEQANHLCAYPAEAHPIDIQHTGFVRQQALTGIMY